MQDQTRLSLVKNGEIEIARNANKQRIPFFARQINHQPLLFSHREAHISMGLTRAAGREHFALICFSINDKESYAGFVTNFGKKHEVKIDGAIETHVSVTFLQASRKVVAKLMISHARHSQVVMVKDIFLYDAASIRGNSFLIEGAALVIEPKLNDIKDLMPSVREEPEDVGLSLYWMGREPSKEICEELERHRIKVISSLHDFTDDLLIINGELDWHPAWFEIFLNSVNRIKVPCITGRLGAATLDLAGNRLDSSLSRELNPLNWGSQSHPEQFSHLYVGKELRDLVPKSIPHDFGDCLILWRIFMMGHEIAYFKSPGAETEKPVSAARRADLESNWINVWQGWTRLHVERIIPKLSNSIPRYPYKVSIITMTSAGSDAIEQLYENLRKNPLTYFSFEWIIVFDGPTTQKISILDPPFSIKMVKPSRTLVNFSEGNNIGIKHASGDYIVFLNDDVRLTESFDTTILSLVMDHKLSGAAPVLEYPNGKIQHAGVVFRKDRNGNSLPDHSLRHQETANLGANRCYRALTAALLAMRTNDVLAHGGFDVKYFWGLEDIDLCLRIGGKFLCLADSRATHEEHATTNKKLTEIAKQQKNIRNCARFISQHSPDNLDEIYLSSNLDFSFHEQESVAIIITSSTRHLLVQCLNSLNVDSKTEVIVVTNAKQVQNEALTRSHRCIFISDPWSYSKFNNQGAIATDKDILIFLNDDIIVRSKNWLSRIRQELTKPGCGAVSPTLTYENGTTQFQGINFVSRGPLQYMPDHIRRGKDPRVISRPIPSAALTGACLAIRRELFFSCGGFNEHYNTECQDTDLSLVLLSKGYSLNVLTDVTMTHLEGATRKVKEDDKDRVRFKQSWRSFIDKYLLKKSIHIWTIRVSDTWGLSRVATNLANAYKGLGHDVTIISSDIELSAKAQLALNGINHKLARQASEVQENADLNIVLSAPYLHQMESMKGPALLYNWGDPPWDLFPASHEIRKNAEIARSHVLSSDINVCHGSDFLKRSGNRQGAIVYPGLDHVSQSFSDKSERMVAFGRTGNEEINYKGYARLEQGMKGRNLDLVTSKYKDKTMSDQEIWDKIHSGHSFLSLSVWEGFNLPLGEANALGVATLALNRGAHSEVADQYFDHEEELFAAAGKCKSPVRKLNYNWTNACLNLLKVI